MSRVTPEYIQLEKLAQIAANHYTYERLGEYLGSSKTYYQCTCLADGHEWPAKLSNLLTGKACKVCGRAATISKKTKPEGYYLEGIFGRGDCEFLGWVGGFCGSSSIARVRCLEDGYEWEATANNLTSSPKGCAMCANRPAWTAEEREAQINAISGVTFVRWVGEYSNIKARIICLCACTNEWETSVSNVLHNGNRCPNCANYGYSPSKPGTLYALRSRCGSMVKVGITNNIARRHSDLKGATPFEWDCIEHLTLEDGAAIAQLEKASHRQLERVFFDGQFNGHTEWFEYTERVPAMFHAYRSKLQCQ